MSDSVSSALKKMNDLDKKLLIVYNKNEFTGLLSIGDIQRAIIKNINLKTPVKAILRKNIRVARESEPFETIKKEMFEFRIECMPVVNEKGELTDVYFWEEVFGSEKISESRKFDIPVIIMAGGRGERLKPITNVLPKPLIPITDKTIIEEIMDCFINAGCNKFYISLNYKAEMIKYYLDNLENKKYNITFFQEKLPLGTAGSLQLLDNKINTPFFVSNCDILIEQNLYDIYEYHTENKYEMTIVAAVKNYSIPYGTLTTGENGCLIDFTEKPDFTFKINSGVYLLEPHLLNEIPHDKFFHITDLIEIIQKRKGKIGVFPISDNSWKDIGEPSELLRLFDIYNKKK